MSVEISSPANVKPISPEVVKNFAKLFEPGTNSVDFINCCIDISEKLKSESLKLSFPFFYRDFSPEYPTQAFDGIFSTDIQNFTDAYKAFQEYPSLSHNYIKLLNAKNALIFTLERILKAPYNPRFITTYPIARVTLKKFLNQIKKYKIEKYESRLDTGSDLARALFYDKSEDMEGLKEYLNSLINNFEIKKFLKKRISFTRKVLKTIIEFLNSILSVYKPGDSTEVVRGRLEQLRFYINGLCQDSTKTDAAIYFPSVQKNLLRLLSKLTVIYGTLEYNISG